MAKQMKTVKTPKNNNVLTGTLPKIGTGHRAHQTGAGTHRHKCDRRQGNRSQKTARIVCEW